MESWVQVLLHTRTLHRSLWCYNWTQIRRTFAFYSCCSVLFVTLFWEEVSLGTPGWSWSQDFLDSSYQVLRLQICANISNCNSILVIVSFLTDFSCCINFMFSKAIALSDWVISNYVTFCGLVIYIVFLAPLNILKVVLAHAIISIVSLE